MKPRWHGRLPNTLSLGLDFIHVSRGSVAYDFLVRFTSSLSSLFVSGFVVVQFAVRFLVGFHETRVDFFNGHLSIIFRRLRRCRNKNSALPEKKLKQNIIKLAKRYKRVGKRANFSGLNRTFQSCKKAAYIGGILFISSFCSSFDKQS